MNHTQKEKKNPSERIHKRGTQKVKALKKGGFPYCSSMWFPKFAESLAVCST